MIFNLITLLIIIPTCVLGNQRSRLLGETSGCQLAVLAFLYDLPRIVSNQFIDQIADLFELGLVILVVGTEVVCPPSILAVAGVTSAHEPVLKGRLVALGRVVLRK